MKKIELLSPCFPPEKMIHLMAINIKNVELDICPKTGGIWFDRFEINKFDETHEDISELLKALPQSPILPEVLKSRKSPKHPAVVMQQQPYGPKGMNGILTVDICSMSAGIWLDYLEIQKLRELYPKESDRKKSVEDFVENSFQLKNEDQKHSVLGLSKLIFNLSK